MQTLETMLAPIQQALQREQNRASAAERNRSAALVLSNCFPLVHRSAKADGPPLSEILSTGRLRATAPCTDREPRCGIDRVLYFFFGCAAYPEGAIAFLAGANVLSEARATYTPFDTGSLEKHTTLRDRSPWTDAEKDDFLSSHLGSGPDVPGFTAEYVAAHFNAPHDYVRRDQRSDPDFPTYHGLVSTSGDRRAWSIEVQLHDDLPLDPQHVDAIVLGQPDLLADIPDDLVERVVIAEAEGSIAPMIHDLILTERSS